MDKKNLKKFLIPVSVLVASLPVGANASADKKGDLNKENETVTSIKKQAKELTMVPTENVQVAGLFTTHSSHSSHGSHGSHASHGSHRSGY